MFITAEITFFNAAVFLISALSAVVVATVLGAFFQHLRRSVLGRLKYTREFSETDVVEGAEIYIVETIFNPTIIPIPFVDIASYIDGRLQIDGYPHNDGMQMVVSRFHLLPFSRTTRRHRIKCAHRGHYTMKSAAVLHKKKMIEYEESFTFDSELFVFPKAVKYLLSTSAINRVQGSETSANKYLLDPFSVVGIRDLAPGDPFNSINFKATARSAYQGVNCIKVNRLDPASDRTFMIYMNFSVPAGEEERLAYEKKWRGQYPSPPVLYTWRPKKGTKSVWRQTARSTTGNESSLSRSRQDVTTRLKFCALSPRRASTTHRHFPLSLRPE